MNNQFQNGLRYFQIENSIFFVDTLDNAKIKLSNEERIHLFKAKTLNATAVYFRRFADRPSIPQVYLYDLAQTEYSPEEKAELHKIIWNQAVAF